MTEWRFVEVDGLRLRVAVDEGGPGSPVIVLHGFTGSSESMAAAAAAIAVDRTTVRIDLLGHGESDAPDETEPYTMARCVGQLVGVVDDLSLVRPHWLGYSMGGRAALSLAARRPERAASLLLVGASPGLESEAARRERVAQDEALADQILREGLPAFVDRWMGLPLFASQKRLGAAALDAARRQRLANRTHGLARSLRGMGTGAMPPLHASLSELDLPVCLAVGEEDPKFRGLADEMRNGLPDARVRVIPQAGHAAHLENPACFGAVAREFFRAADAKGRSVRASVERSPAARPPCRP